MNVEEGTRGPVMRPGTFFAVAAAMLALAATGCRHDAPEQALRNDVAAIVQAIGQRDATALDAYLADDFIGPDGLDRAGARRLARVVFMRNRRIGIVPGPLDVRLGPRHATVRFGVAVSGGQGGLLPERGQLYQVETGWRLEGGEWRLTSADWKPALR